MITRVMSYIYIYDVLCTNDLLNFAVYLSKLMVSFEYSISLNCKGLLKSCVISRVLSYARYDVCNDF